MGAFPSGQRGQTVNLLSLTSVVRIHPLPPKNSIALRCYFFIQADRLGISSTRFASCISPRREACISSAPKGLYENPPAGVHLCRLDDIQSFGLMIYNSCGIDDIHAYGVIRMRGCGKLLLFPLFYAIINYRKAVIPC